MNGHNDERAFETEQEFLQRLLDYNDGIVMYRKMVTVLNDDRVEEQLVDVEQRQPEQLSFDWMVL